MIALLSCLAFGGVDPAPAPPPDAPAVPPVPEAPPLAPTTIDLAWEVPAGHKLQMTEAVTTAVNTPLGAQKNTVTTVSEQTVRTGGRLGTDPLAWTEKILHQDVEVDMAGQKTTWTSDKKDVDPPGGFEALPLLAAASWEVTVGPDLAVAVKVQAEDKAKIAEKAGEAGLSEDYAASILDEDRLAADTRRQLATFTGGGLAVGQSTKEAVTLPVPGLGEVQAERTLTLDRVEGGEAHLSETWALVSAKLEGVEVSEFKGSGEIVYDVSSRLPRQESTTIEMVLTATGATPMPMKTTLERETRIEVK
jgi:hypothetical protein